MLILASKGSLKTLTRCNAAGRPSRAVRDSLGDFCFMDRTREIPSREASADDLKRAGENALPPGTPGEKQRAHIARNTLHTMFQERLASIVESSDDAIISKDLNGIIQSWNRGAERIFGYTADEAVGKHISMLAAPDRVDEIPNILERISRGERIDQRAVGDTALRVAGAVHEIPTVGEALGRCGAAVVQGEDPGRNEGAVEAVTDRVGAKRGDQQPAIGARRLKRLALQVAAQPFVSRLEIDTRAMRP